MRVFSVGFYGARFAAVAVVAFIVGVRIGIVVAIVIVSCSSAVFVGCFVGMSGAMGVRIPMSHITRWCIGVGIVVIGENDLRKVGFIPNDHTRVIFWKLCSFWNVRHLHLHVVAIGIDINIYVTIAIVVLVIGLELRRREGSTMARAIDDLFPILF